MCRYAAQRPCPGEGGWTFRSRTLVFRELPLYSTLSLSLSLILSHLRITPVLSSVSNLQIEKPGETERKREWEGKESVQRCQDCVHPGVGGLSAQRFVLNIIVKVFNYYVMSYNPIERGIVTLYLLPYMVITNYFTYNIRYRKS